MDTMKRNYSVTVKGERPILVPQGTLFQDVADRFQHKFTSPIMLVKIGNEFQELRKEITEDCAVELFDLTHADGMRVYQRSVNFLLIYAAKLVLGKEAEISIEHSINKNIYCEVNNISLLLTQDLLDEIEEKMKQMAEEDIPIEKYSVPLDKGIQLVRKFGMKDKEEVLKYRRVSSVNLYKLGWLYDYFYGYMASSTGPLKLFKLILQDEGFVLQFPSTSSPNELEAYRPVQKISNVFKEYSQWGKILKVDTVGDLNNIICQGDIGNIIRVSEALQEKKIGQIADMITENRENTKLVLVAGPSSSGKTTFAQRLCVQLRVNGITPHVLSVDNYFKNRNEAPLDEEGNPNFEALDFVDIELFNKDLTALLENEKIRLPYYNFLTGKREFGGNTLKLNQNEVLVVEGIHCLNEKLTPAVPRKNKFKIFISALTQLSIDRHNRISTTDTRLLRRITRDSQFRGAPAAKTISMWSSIAKGESEFIFPFQEEADTMFNSALIYELFVLKQYVEPLLFNVGRDCPEFTEAKRLIKFLDSFLGVSSEEVPPNSIIREFIGRSCFHT